MSRSSLSTEGRFWQKVGGGRDPDECWPWLASLDPYGYGRFQSYAGRTMKAHRFAYELLIGPAPPIIDHTCHVASECVGGRACPHRRCCNPRHMAPSTIAANALRGTGPQATNARKTLCPEGHPYDYHWTSKDGRKHRDCLQCRRRRGRDYQREKRNRRKAL